MEDGLSVNREAIDNWIYEHRPDGLSRLAVASGLTSDAIGRARRGKVPSKIQRQKLAETLNLPVEVVFPAKEVSGAVS